MNLLVLLEIDPLGPIQIKMPHRAISVNCFTCRFCVWARRMPASSARGSLNGVCSMGYNTEAQRSLKNILVRPVSNLYWKQWGTTLEQDI